MKNIFTKLSVILSNIYLVAIWSHHLIAFWINITTFHEICAQIYLLQEKEMATHSSILAWRISMDKGAWWATVYGVAKSWTGLKWLSMHTYLFDLCAASPTLLRILRDSKKLKAFLKVTQLVRESGLTFEPGWLQWLCVCVLVAQLCPTLCDPMNFSPPGSSIDEQGSRRAAILLCF